MSKHKAILYVAFVVLLEVISRKSIASRDFNDFVSGKQPETYGQKTLIGCFSDETKFLTASAMLKSGQTNSILWAAVFLETLGGEPGHKTVSSFLMKCNDSGLAGRILLYYHFDLAVSENGSVNVSDIPDAEVYAHLRAMNEPPYWGLATALSWSPSELARDILGSLLVNDLGLRGEELLGAREHIWLCLVDWFSRYSKTLGLTFDKVLTYTYSGDGLKRAEYRSGTWTTLVWDGSDYLGEM